MNLDGRQCTEETGARCGPLLLEMIKFLHKQKAKPFSKLIFCIKGFSEEVLHDNFK